MWNDIEKQNSAIKFEPFDVDKLRFLKKKIIVNIKAGINLWKWLTYSVHV